MVSVANYSGICKEVFEGSGIYQLVIYEYPSCCPSCGGDLRYYDSRNRTVRLADGEKIKLRVRRFRCAKCGKVHTELPDFLLPYKQYVAYAVSHELEKTFDDNLTAEVSLAEDKAVVFVPADEDEKPMDVQNVETEGYDPRTARRWTEWFTHRLADIEGSLVRAETAAQTNADVLEMSKISRLDTLRRKCRNWLGRAFRAICATGGFVAPYYGGG